MRVLVSITQTLAYYASFPIFVLLSFSLNCYSLLASWLPAKPGIERFFQRLTHLHFAIFVRWLRVSRLVPLVYEGFERWPRSRGLVVVANHPGLLDIGFLLARVPEAVCVFKPAIGYNPLFNATARRAGYIASNGGHHLLRDAAAKVAAGYTLIIFPEGTRTKDGGTLNPLKPGFAAIARIAKAPIQLVRITSDSRLLGKGGRSWWRVPHLPAHVKLSLGPCLPPPNADSATVAQIEAWFREEPAAARSAGAPWASMPVNPQA